jgi:hypothetical protein
MFYNGFTLLMQLLAGATAYWIGHRYGYDRGQTEMYQTLKNLDEKSREFFSTVSKK